MHTETKSCGPLLEKDKLIDLYRQMLTIREFEEQAQDLYTRAVIPGILHLSIGQEAVPVGVCSALRSDDYITSTHRGARSLPGKRG